MPRRRVLKAVLHNFLGTYTSRYSDWDGFWMFGFLESSLLPWRIDLLAAAVDTTLPEHQQAAGRLAIAKFRDQVAKAGLTMSVIREATLEMTQLPGFRDCLVNGHIRKGREWLFRAEARTDNARRFTSERTIAVAPHDPRVELRSARSHTPS